MVLLKRLLTSAGMWTIQEIKFVCASTPTIWLCNLSCKNFQCPSPSCEECWWGGCFLLLSRSSMMLVASRSCVYFGSQFWVTTVYMLKYVLCHVLVSLVCKSVSYLNWLCVLYILNSWSLFTLFLKLHLPCS